MSFSPFTTAPVLVPVINSITEREAPSTTFDVRKGKGLGAAAIAPNTTRYKKNFLAS